MRKSSYCIRRIILRISENVNKLTFVSLKCSFWPAFVPVHDPSREAYIGIQNMGTVFTRRFEADRLGSQVPVKFMHLEGLYELFVSKFVSLFLISCTAYCPIAISTVFLENVASLLSIFF